LKSGLTIRIHASSTHERLTRNEGKCNRAARSRVYDRLAVNEHGGRRERPPRGKSLKRLKRANRVSPLRSLRMTCRRPRVNASARGRCASA
jgi:hypothetical protein